jgi:hypothetical protein
VKKIRQKTTYIEKYIFFNRNILLFIVNKANLCHYYSYSDTKQTNMTKNIKYLENFFNQFKSVIDTIQSSPGYMQLGLNDKLNQLEGGADALRTMAKVSFNYFISNNDSSKSENLRRIWDKLNDRLKSLTNEVNIFLTSPIGSNRDFFLNISSRLEDLLKDGVRVVEHTNDTLVNSIATLAREINNKINAL